VRGYACRLWTIAGCARLPTRATGTVVEVDHPTRGKYISVGNPIKLPGSPSDVTRSPLLGEHADEILRHVLGFSDH
jgi:formyl-CoA transferase